MYVKEMLSHHMSLSMLGMGIDPQPKTGRSVFGERGLLVS